MIQNNINNTLSGNQDSQPAEEKNESVSNAVLVIDNYDSFTYNLVHVIKKISNLRVDVYRNDELSLPEVDKYNRIILSPGPGLPEEAGLLLNIIKTYAPTKHILGVCLGHQAIGETFGATLQNLPQVYHGIASKISKTKYKSILFEGLPDVFEAGRYHSWIVEKENLPDCFEITSTDSEGRIMSMRHKKYNLEGVQFHPESVLTPLGEKMIYNWLKAASQNNEELFKELSTENM